MAQCKVGVELLRHFRLISDQGPLLVDERSDRYLGCGFFLHIVEEGFAVLVFFLCSFIVSIIVELCRPGLGIRSFDFRANLSFFVKK